MMKIKPLLLIVALLNTSMIITPNAFSAEQAYGWQLMTEQERNQYRETMRNLKTEQERERYRIEHHNMMQERAKEKGISLPDEPGSRMNGNGPGNGMGGSMGGGKGGGR